MASPIQIGPGATTEQMISVINENFRQIERESRTQIIRDESGVNRIILGRMPDGTYGLLVTKPNVDALALFT